jgi:hypothetical protein
MILLLAATVLATPADLSVRVTGASLFKNGFSMVTREADVRPGEWLWSELPAASLGTFWIVGTGGVRIDQVTFGQQEVATERNAANLDEILQANVGRNVRIGLPSGDSLARQEREGRILSADGQIVVLQVSEGETIAIQKPRIQSIASEGSTELLFKVKGAEQRRTLRFRLSGGPGKIQMVGLERGMAWVPAYSLDISDPKTLALTARATVINELTDLNGVELRLVTGFPNVQWSSFTEPLLSGQTLDQFLQMLSGVGARGADFSRRESIMTQNAPAAMGGGMGGGFTPSDLEGLQAEDLFFYRQHNVQMKRGDRGYFVLFGANSPYEHLYTVEIPDLLGRFEGGMPPGASVPEPNLDVWHRIQFRNASNQPLTTGTASVYKGGQLIGQDTLNYTSRGGEASVRLTKALDVRTEQSEEEVERKRGVLALPNGVRYDQVTVRGTIVVRNGKADPTPMQVTKDLTGEVTQIDPGAAVSKTVRGLRDVNSRGRIEWKPVVPPGQERKLSYTYELYVRSS